MYPMDEVDPYAVDEPSTGKVLKKSTKKSAGGALTQSAEQPRALPNAIQALRDRATGLYDQGAKLMDQEPDMSGLQAFARQRSQQGDSAMLNALAAQFAGEGFQPVQAQFLKKAAAAQDPIKMGSGIITPDGQYLKDPEVAMTKKAEFLMQQAKAYEQMAATAQTAQEKVEAQRAQNEIQNALRLMGIQIQQQGLALRGENAALARAMAEGRVQDKKAQELDAGTAKLSKQAGDLTNLYAGVEQLNGMLERYVPNGKSIPGIGYGSDISVLGLDVSGALMGEEGKANRAAVKNVANELLRLASGQAVTINEYQRQVLANMSSGSYSEKDFLNAYNNVILPKVNEAMANIAGGYSPEVKQRYLDNGGKMNFNKPFVAPSKPGVVGAAPAGVDPKVWVHMTPEEKALWK